MPDVNITWNEARKMQYLASRLLREWQDAVDSNPEFRRYGCMVRRYEKEFDELVREFDKEKLTPVGNAAKMREALKETQSAIAKCMDILNKIPDGCGYNGFIDDVAEEMGYLLEEYVKSALAAPPRNCDVLFLDRVEMYGAFKDWCKAKGHTMEPMLAYDAFDWLLASVTKEGEGNGSK